MARKTREEAERTQHILLDAAAALFTKKGVSNTTLNDIAQKAGMTRGAIYWHFDNKDSVILALWERNAAQAHQDFLEQLKLNNTENPAQFLRALIKGIVQQVASEPQLAQVMRIVMNNVELTDEETELQRFMQEKRVLLRTHLQLAFENLAQQGFIKANLPPDLLSQGLLAYLHGLIHAYLEPGRATLDLKRDGDTLLDLYLDTILL